jgi:transposase
MASVSEEKQSEILRLISEKTDLTIKFYKDRLDAYKVLYNDISNVREILKKRIKLILTE